jgi:hypothetical protein
VELTGEWDEELHIFLAAAFAPEDLYRWIYFHFADLRADLPPATHTTPAAFAFAALERLTQRGHITDTLFDKLARKRIAHGPRIEAIRAQWRAKTTPLPVGHTAVPVAAPPPTAPSPPAPGLLRVPRTVLVLDRVEQWRKIRDRCNDDDRHLAFIIHGSRRQNVVLFADRLEKHLREGMVRAHGTPHRVERRGDGSTAVAAGDWAAHTIAATDRERGPLETALRFDAQHHATSYLYLDRGAPLHDLGGDAREGLVMFLRSDLPKALAVAGAANPLRFFFPVEDNLPLAQALHAALSHPTARRQLHVYDEILELTFPPWHEVEKYIHAEFGAVPDAIRGACERCYDAADAAGHDLRTLADGLRNILHDWEDEHR